MKVLPDKEEDALWDEIQKRYKYPIGREEAFDAKLPCKWKAFKLPASAWSQEQEYLVNDIFKSLSDKDLYALDWQHDCFIYNPSENIPLFTFWEDREKDCKVYFPSYYPNGDYHAFTSMDLKYGLWGHPWEKEIYVVGESLIELFEKNKDKLSIAAI